MAETPENVAPEPIKPPDCAFCDIVARIAPAKIITDLSFAVVIEPLNPVTEGHALVVPHGHARDALESIEISGLAFQAACQYAMKHQHVNLITSVGMLATQSIKHLHIHVLPRHPYDGLVLPWGDNERQSREYKQAAYDFYNGTPTGSEEEADRG